MQVSGKLPVTSSGLGGPDPVDSKAAKDTVGLKEAADGTGLKPTTADGVGLKEKTEAAKKSDCLKVLRYKSHNDSEDFKKIDKALNDLEHFDHLKSTVYLSKNSDGKVGLTIESKRNNAGVSKSWVTMQVTGGTSKDTSFSAETFFKLHPEFLKDKDADLSKIDWENYGSLVDVSDPKLVKEMKTYLINQDIQTVSLNMKAEKKDLKKRLNLLNDENITIDDLVKKFKRKDDKAEVIETGTHTVKVFLPSDREILDKLKTEKPDLYGSKNKVEVDDIREFLKLSCEGKDDAEKEKNLTDHLQRYAAYQIKPALKCFKLRGRMQISTGEGYSLEGKYLGKYVETSPETSLTQSIFKKTRWYWDDMRSAGEASINSIQEELKQYKTKQKILKNPKVDIQRKTEIKKEMEAHKLKMKYHALRYQSLNGMSVELLGSTLEASRNEFKISEKLVFNDEKGDFLSDLEEIHDLMDETLPASSEQPAGAFDHTAHVIDGIGLATPPPPAAPAPSASTTKKADEDDNTEVELSESGYRSDGSDKGTGLLETAKEQQKLAEEAAEKKAKAIELAEESEDRLGSLGIRELLERAEIEYESNHPNIQEGSAQTQQPQMTPPNTTNEETLSEIIKPLNAATTSSPEPKSFDVSKEETTPSIPVAQQPDTVDTANIGPNDLSEKQNSSVLPTVEQPEQKPQEEVAAKDANQIPQNQPTIPLKETMPEEKVQTNEIQDKELKDLEKELESETNSLKNELTTLLEDIELLLKTLPEYNPSMREKTDFDKALKDWKEKLDAAKSYCEETLKLTDDRLNKNREYIEKNINAISAGIKIYQTKMKEGGVKP